MDDSGLRGTMKSRRYGQLVLALVLFACDGGTGPEGASLRILAGNGVSDTIDTEFPQALVVEARDASGAPAPGVVLRYQSLPIDDTYGSFGAVMSTLESSFFQGFLADTTDDRGRSSVVVKLGARVGDARIAISAPELGVSDTARFTVRAGNAARVQAQPGDTALMVGRSFTFRGGSVDRYGNPRPDPIEVVSTTDEVGAAGTTITAQSVGRARIVLRALGVLDTVFVSVVPAGVLAAGRSDGVWVFNTDGSELRRLTTGPAGNPKWSPAGTHIVYDQVWPGRLHIVDLTGSVRPLSSAPLGLEAELFPQWTRDGQWVYFSAYTWSGVRLWRIRAGGSEGAAVPINRTENSGNPSPSPDGSRVAYVNIIGGGNDFLRMLDVATANVTVFDIPGHSPHWSPSGEWIAYLDFRGTSSGPMRVMRPDGSDQRAITDPLTQRYSFGMDWSPDEQWLVGANVMTGRIEIVNVQTGETLPLSFTAGMTAPTWKR